MIIPAVEVISVKVQSPSQIPDPAVVEVQVEVQVGIPPDLTVFMESQNESKLI